MREAMSLQKEARNSFAKNSSEACGSTEENGFDGIQSAETISSNCSSNGKHVYFDQGS